MLHEELLETVDSVGNLLNQQTTFTSQGLMNLYAIKALRAVVELHQSVELEPDGYPIVFCKNCFDDAGYQEPYPCQTIQTIEKELM